MNATFCLDVPSPATRTRVLSGFHCFCAGPTTNAWVPVIMQRIVRKIVCMYMLPHLITRPGGKRIELDHLVGIIPFDKPGVRAESCLVTADARDPGIVVGKKLPLRNHLADLAAGIGITLP